MEKFKFENELLTVEEELQELQKLNEEYADDGGMLIPALVEEAPSDYLYADSESNDISAVKDALKNLEPISEADYAEEVPYCTPIDSVLEYNLNGHTIYYGVVHDGVSGGYQMCALPEELVEYVD